MIDRVARFVLTALLGLACALIAVPLAHPNPGPIFTDGFESPVDPCDDPMVMPEGWARVTWTWEKQWSAPNRSLIAEYPNSIGFPIPLGSGKRGYKVVPFIPRANESVVIDWREAQAQPVIGYNQARVADGMWLAISQCPGDLRAASNTGDPYLSPKCRTFAYAGTLVYSSNDPKACLVTPGVVHYLTVTPHAPGDPVELDTCVVETHPSCEVNAASTGAPTTAEAKRRAVKSALSRGLN